VLPNNWSAPWDLIRPAPSITLKMIGIGPFITIGVINYVMDGPQARFGRFLDDGADVSHNAGYLHHKLGLFENSLRAGSRGKLV